MPTLKPLITNELGFVHSHCNASYFDFEKDSVVLDNSDNFQINYFYSSELFVGEAMRYCWNLTN